MVPAFAVTVTDPLLAPKQVMLICEVIDPVSVAGCVIETGTVTVHEFAS
jgi:hypothetical protein